MVGRRPRAVNWPSQIHKTHPTFPRRRRTKPHGHRYRDDDQEAAVSSAQGSGHPPTATQSDDFKDAAALLAAEQRRADLKRRVLDGMQELDLGELDRTLRKSDIDLSSIRDKKVRRFYQRQNETLDAWLEVDALVYAVADDVIDSMVSSLARLSRPLSEPQIDTGSRIRMQIGTG